MADAANTETLGELVRAARVAQKLKLREAARALNLAPSYLSDIENDRRVPAEEVLGRIAALLGLDFEELMARAGRVGEKAERYLRREPGAAMLFRRVSEAQLQGQELREMLKFVEELKRRRQGKPETPDG